MMTIPGRQPSAAAHPLAGCTRLWLGFLLALAVGPLAAQIAPSFRQLSLREGLPQSQVTTLLRDSRGFIWVGTNAGGVARLGANGFQTFGAPQGLVARQVSALWEAPDGSILVSSRDEGLSAIRGNRVVNFPSDRDQGPTGCFDLGPAPGGGVAVASVKGLWTFREGRLARADLGCPLDGQRIYSLALEGNDHLWMLGRELLGVWDGRRFEARPTPEGRRPQDLVVLRRDPRGRVCALYPDVLYRWEQGAWRREPFSADVPKGVRATNLAFGLRGGLILSLGDDGLWVGDAGPAGRHHPTGRGLPLDKVNVALEDPNGALWVGTDGSGLVSLSRPALGSLTLDLRKYGLPLGAVMSILELAPGHLLLAGSQGLYEVKEDVVVGHWSRKEGLPSTSCWSLVTDRAGGAFVGTDTGITRWRSGRVQPIPPHPDLQRTAVTSMVWHGGRLIAGTERGLFELDPAGRMLAHHIVPPDLGSNPIGALCAWKGELLVGLSRGLARFEGGRFVPVHVGSPLTGQVISAIAPDAQGRLWVGASRGLWVLDQGAWRAQGYREGLPDDAISFIVDLKGRGVIVGHGQGITLIQEGRLTHLTEAVGLLSNETNAGGAWLDSRNRLWIGMVTGVCILDLNQPLPKETLRPPRLVELSWPEGFAWGDGPLTIPPGAASINLAMDVPHAVLPFRPRIQIRLQGLETDYQELPPDGRLQIRSLPPGRYHLEARASLDSKAWVEADPIPLRVIPAWHQRWQTRTLFVLLLLGAGGSVFYLRYHALAREAQRLEAAVEERTHAIARQNRALEQAHDQIRRTLEARMRLLDTLAHDLRSPLTSIMLAADRVRDGLPEESILAGPVSVLDHESRRIELLLRGLLDQRRSEALLQSLELEPSTPRELLGGLEGVLRIKAEARELDLRFEPDEATAFLPLRVDPGALQQALFNLFENSLKFTPTGGTVGVRTALDTARREWRLTVWDTGRGISPEAVEAILQPFRQADATDAGSGWGLGLSIVRSLLEAQGGRLEVESQLDRGSAFTLVLPVPEEAL